MCELGPACDTVSAVESTMMLPPVTEMSPFDLASSVRPEPSRQMAQGPPATWVVVLVVTSVCFRVTVAVAAACRLSDLLPVTPANNVENDFVGIRTRRCIEIVSSLGLERAGQVLKSAEMHPSPESGW